jgi:eukaryotic-like serine/threonine-protein kinase
MSALGHERWQALSDYLDHAFDLTVTERWAWLRSLEREQPVIAAELRSMLDEHAALSRERFLEDALPVRGTSLAGQTLGAYTLVSPLGQGGMGTVWLAERTDGRFTGRAAVKLLNMALVGKAGEERFRREGSILARLRHPNIAHLVDAGVAPNGQPYLVIEHVDGEHIDKYCDGRRLGLEARVRIFLDVLSAVAHAHSNLIVHRDLKPSNVLVRNDGQVKLLDFGIAKLLEGETQSAAPTLTVDAGRALTPEYAAPEQLTGAPITTATDVYALGVLLYVVLSGRHPAGTAVQGPAELLRSTLEAVPPKLSTAMGRAGDDLDLIVGKALKKDAEERYPSVTALADDLRRYLNHQPIAARADTITYRARKFARRNWRAIAVAAAGLLIVASLVAFYTFRLAAERDRARLEADKAAKISELLTGILTGADPFAERDTQEPTVRQLLDAGAARVERELSGQPELEAEMLTLIGRVYQRMEAGDKAQPLLEKALALGRRTFAGDHVLLARTLSELGVVLREKREFAKAGPVLEEAVAMRRRLVGPEHRDLAITLVELGRHYWDAGSPDRAEPVFREALAMRRRLFGDENRETATSMNELGLLLWEKGNLDEAEQLLRVSSAINQRVLRDGHPNLAAGFNNLGLVLSERGREREAEPFFQRAIDIDRKVFGPHHITVANYFNNLSHALRRQGKFDEAETVLRQALEISATKGRDHPSAGMYTTNLGRVYLARGLPARAEALFREGLRIRRLTLQEDDWRIGVTKSLLGAALTEMGRLDEAEPLLHAAVASIKGTDGVQGREAQEARDRLAALSEARKRSAR